MGGFTFVFFHVSKHLQEQFLDMINSAKRNYYTHSTQINDNEKNMQGIQRIHVETHSTQYRITML